MVTPGLTEAVCAAGPVVAAGEDGTEPADTPVRRAQASIEAPPRQDAAAVRGDMVERSLLAERRLERELAALERLILVPSTRKS